MRAALAILFTLQPNSVATPLLPQLSPYVSELALYDIAGTPGVAADVSHINSKAAVKGYAGAQAQGPRVVLRGGHAWLLLENWRVPAVTARRRSRATRVRGVLFRACAGTRAGLLLEICRCTRVTDRQRCRATLDLACSVGSCSVSQLR